MKKNTKIEHQNTEIITTAADVYRHLVDEGLMLRKDGSGRDDALWTELITRLNFPISTTNIPQALEDSNTSVEDFIRAFFTCFEPFAVMMADICLVMQKLDAQKSYRSLSVSYTFSGEDDVVDFSLSHFRDFWRSYQKLYQRAVFRFWNEYDIDRFREDLERHSLAYSINSATTSENEHWMPSDNFPSEWNSDKEVMSIAKTLQALWNSLVEVSSYSSEVDAISSVLVDTHSQKEWRNDEFEEEDTLGRFFINQEVTARPLNTDDVNHLKEIICLASGNLCQIAILRQNEDSPKFGDEYEYNKPNSLVGIIKHYYDLPTEERIIESLSEEIHTILNLPVWKHRWQLYQVWVGLYALDRLQNTGLSLNVYIENSKIELYEQHPAQIADIAGCRVPVSYWAELQTAVTGPDEKINSIRPDYKLAKSSVTNPINTLLLIEAKQRRFMSIPNMEKLYNRYKQGCPDGTLIFVNYDAFPDIEKTDSNTLFISQFRPGNNAAKRQVDECLDDISNMIKDEQKIVREERESDERKEIAKLIELSAEHVKGIDFVKGFHSAHKNERVGAIILDYRTTKARGLFGVGCERDTVVQTIRANPLAQVWLAGINVPPKLAYDFDYDKDRQGDEIECDLYKLTSELQDTVQGVIIIIGYSSNLRNLSFSSRIRLHCYSD